MDELVPSIFEVGSATEISVPNLRGTVILHITDDDGIKHSLTLENVNYFPNLSINILSLCHLAELYPDDTGHPDRSGTGITSGYDSHTKHWNRIQFRKTFQTLSSGLLELLFSSGYSKFDAFTTMIANIYDDTISWVFASTDKLQDLVQLDNGHSIAKYGDLFVYVDNDGIMIDMPFTPANLASFLNGVHLRYNDGNRTRNIVTFMGTNSVNNMQIKCKVKLSDGKFIVVDPETLNFIENPDVASILKTMFGKVSTYHRHN